MRRPTLDGLPPQPPLPPGYALRSYREGDLGALASVLRAAFDDPTWTPERVRTTLTNAPDVAQTLVIDHGGVPVATASARLKADFPGSGYVHWVAAAPAHRGFGLGYAVTLAVLHVFTEMGCRAAVLKTDDERLAAIRAYRRLGFRPEHQDATHPARWAIVEAELAEGTPPDGPETALPIGLGHE